MSLLDQRGGHWSCECHDLQPEGNKNTVASMYVYVRTHAKYHIRYAYTRMYIFVVCNDMQ